MATENYIPRSSEVRVQAAARILAANPYRNFLDIHNTDANVAVKIKIGGDFTPAQSCVQHLSGSEAPTDGALSLSLGDIALDPIPATADAAVLQAILEDAVGAGNVAVTGNWTEGFVITFQAELANKPVPALVLGENTLKTNAHARPETVTVALPYIPGTGSLTLGMEGWDDLVLPYNATAADAEAASQALAEPWPCAFDGSLVNGLLSLTFEYPGAPSPVVVKANSMLLPVDDPTDEVQVVAFNPQPDAGAFVLGFGGETTNRLAYNVTAEQLQAELEALDAIGAGNVTVTGSVAAGFVVTFGGTLAGLDQPTLYPVPISRIDQPFAGTYGLYLGRATYPSTHDVQVGVIERTAGSVAQPAPAQLEREASETLRDVVVEVAVATEGNDGLEGIEILAGGRKSWETNIPLAEIWAKSEGEPVNLELTEG